MLKFMLLMLNPILTMFSILFYEFVGELSQFEAKVLILCPGRISVQEASYQMKARKAEVPMYPPGRRPCHHICAQEAPRLEPKGVQNSPRRLSAMKAPKPERGALPEFISAPEHRRRRPRRK